MVMLRCGGKDQEAFRLQLQAAKSLNRSLKGGISGSSHTLNSLATKLSVTVVITMNVLLLMRM
jgi:hypothetical protein